MGNRRKSPADRDLSYIVNAMTTDEYRRLIQIVDPLTPQQEAEFGAMSDDELLAALGLSA